MYERVLVTLDGSSLSEAALPIARQLASKAGSLLTLVHVTPPFDIPYEHMHRLYLQKLADMTKSGVAGGSGDRHRAITVETAALSGDPAEEIVQYADKVDAGLVVMTTHGYSGVKRWALGSVADKIVRATSRPVLLIRSGGEKESAKGIDPLKKMIVTLDGSETAESVIPYAEDMAASLGLEVVLLQVLATGYVIARTSEYILYTDQQIEADKAEAIDYLKDVADRFFKQRVVTTTTEVRVGDSSEEIIGFAQEVSADLVAMSTHGRSGAGRWVFGSVSDRVLRNGDTPLLLVRCPAAKVEKGRLQSRANIPEGGVLK